MIELRHLDNESDVAYRQRMLVELAQMDKSDSLAALKVILQASTVALGASRAEYWSFDGDAVSITRIMLYNHVTGKLDLDTTSVTLTQEEYPEYFSALIQERAVIAHNVAEHPATQRLASTRLSMQDVVSMLDTAVWLNKKLVGVLCLETIGYVHAWHAEEELFASFASAMIALTLETAERKNQEMAYRRQEEQYRYIIENSTDGIYQTDSRGCFTFVNDAVLVILGFEESEIIGKRYYRIARPDYRIKALRLYYQQFQERIRSTYFEFPALRKDGEEVWLGQNVQLVLENGKAVGFQAVVRNVTQRKLAEHEIFKTLEKERQLGELKSRFVSMVLHELRTPLTGISLSTEMLQRYAGKINEQQKTKSYQKIFENIKRIIALMDGILLLSEMEANKLSFKPSPMNMEEFCRRLIFEMAENDDPSIIENIHFSLQDSGGVAMGDETLLRHILGHLLLNAVKYSRHARKEAIDIRFEVFCLPDKTTFTISDSGIGIPEEDLSLVFETFHRAKNAAETIPGTGVGLSVVKQCVTMHHGTIEVSSVLGEGTTFVVTIPRTYKIAVPQPSLSHHRS